MNTIALQGRGVLALYGLVKEGDDYYVGSERRQTDAAKLTFPLQLVIVIVGGIMATTGAFWFATSSLRSDMRDVLTRMDAAMKLEETKERLQQERYDALRDDVKAMRNRQELQQLEIQSLKEVIVAAQGRIK